MFDTKYFVDRHGIPKRYIYISIFKFFELLVVRRIVGFHRLMHACRHVFKVIGFDVETAVFVHYFDLDLLF